MRPTSVLTILGAALAAASFSTVRAQQATGAVPQKTAAAGLGGLLGGLAKKKMAARNGDAGSNARTTFMTSTTEVLKIATAVAVADVDVPVGFKENN